MNFFQVADGRSIKLSEIEAVEKIDDFNCRILTETREYDARVPYATMLSILESFYDSQDEEERKEVQTLQQISHKVGELGNFAG